VDVNDLSKPLDEKNLRVGYADLLRALGDVQPKFGTKSGEGAGGGGGQQYAAHCDSG